MSGEGIASAAAPVEQTGSPSSIHSRAGLPLPPPGSSGEVIFEGERIPVSVAGLRIGRDPDSDVVVANETASREHAAIDHRDGRCYVADLDSVNGTLLNGERLHGEARWLSSGDTISVAGERLRYLEGTATTFGQVPDMPETTRQARFEGRRNAIGRDPANEIVLDDPNVSRFHAEVVRTDAGGFELLDLGSRNGTRLDGDPVRRAALEVGSEIGIGPFRLLFDGDAVTTRDDRGALRMRAEKLTIEAHGKVILNRAEVALDPGEFVVVIGESGSGKSTMLKALAGVTAPSGGAVTVNGEPVTARLTDIGYVPQDEIVHPHLTVREALAYSARLRLPTDTGEADIISAVDRVLEELALAEHAGTRIGSLSGGQRKRVGMGAELLTRPSLFFLDEPTTGLDPGLETRMMELFRSLAEERRRAVMVVTHATKNLDLADRVCVMGRGGEVTFSGTPAAAKEFFGVDDYDGIYTALDERDAAEWRWRFERNRAPEPAGEPGTAVMSNIAATRRRGPPRRRTSAQAGVLIGRYLKLIVRDRQNLAILIGQVPIIALGVALLFQSGVLDGPGAGNGRDATQIIFLLVITAIWLGAIDGSREIIKERALWMRESAAGVHLGSYLGSKAVVLAGLVAVQATLLSLVVFAIHPLQAAGTAQLKVTAILVLTGFVAVGMGLLVSTLVSSEDQATSLIPLTLIPQLLFAGAIVPVERMGELIAALSNLIFARWAYAVAGTDIDMNARLAATGEGTLAEFGTTFFELRTANGVVVLALFAAAFFGAVYHRMSRWQG